MGKSGGLHWATEGAETAAEATGAEAMPRKATAPNAVPAATAAIRHFRTVRVPILDWTIDEDRAVLCDPRDESVKLMCLELRARRREHSDDNDQADHTVCPPSWIPRNKQPSVTDVRDLSTVSWIVKTSKIFLVNFRYRVSVANWSFLTNHGRALLCIARDPDIRLRDLAAELGITERHAYAVVTDLTDAGYVVKTREGRRNRYQVQNHLALPDLPDRKQAIGEVLDVLAGRAPKRKSTGRVKN